MVPVPFTAIPYASTGVAIEAFTCKSIEFLSPVALTKSIEDETELASSLDPLFHEGIE